MRAPDDTPARGDSDGVVEAALAAIDVGRLLDTARVLIDTPSPTGVARPCTERLADRLGAAPPRPLDLDYRLSVHPPEVPG